MLLSPTRKASAQPPLQSPATPAAARTPLATRNNSSFRDDAKPEIGFTYLKPKQQSASQQRGVPNFYDLDECDFTECGSNYFTLSSDGVTHMVNGLSEFTPLDVWQREKLIFSRIIEIPFFYHFQVWKAFVTWRRTIRQAKIAKARTKLSKSLFALDPHIRVALFEVRQHCQDLAAIQPMNIPDQPLVLDDFEHQQTMACAAAGKEIDKIVTDIANLVLDACERAMTAAGFGLPDVDSPKKNSDEVHETYTEQALKRSECRRLTNFIRLTDYLVVDALYLMTLSIERAILARVRELSTKMAPDAVEFTDEGLEIVGPAPIGKDIAAPLFSTDAELVDSELRINPLGSQFTHLVDSSLDEIVTLADNVQRLVTHEAFDQYTLTGAGDGSELPEPPSVQVMFTVNPEFTDLAAELRSTVEKTSKEAVGFLGKLDKVVETYHRGMSTDIAETLRNTQPDVEAYQRLLTQADRDVALVNSIPDAIDCGCIRVSMKSLVETLRPIPVQAQKALHDAIPGFIHNLAAGLLSDLGVADSSLSKQPADVPSFVSYLDTLDEALNHIDSWDEQFIQVRNLYQLLDESSIPVPAEDLAEFQSLSETIQQLKASMEFSEQGRDASIAKYSAELEQLVEVLRGDINTLRTDAQDSKFDSPDSIDNSSLMVAATTELKTRLKKLQGTAKEYEQHHDRFNMSEPKFEDLEDVAQLVNLRHQLWDTLASWDTQADGWLATAFADLETEDIQARVQRASKTVFMLDKGLPGCPVVPIVREKVDKFKRSLPIAVDLRNPSMTERHWAKVEEALGAAVPEGDEFTFGWLLENGALAHVEDLNTISVEASNEATLLGMIQKIADNWVSAELTLVNHRDQSSVFILTSLDDVMAQLEDNLVTVSTIRSSRFAYAVAEQIEEWDTKLNVFSDTLDEWIVFQKNWLYLEVIFGAADIQRQLPTEAKLFDNADRFWKKTMLTTRDFPNALAAATTAGLCDEFKEHNATLEKIQKSLEEYLETKCMAFPRFYFLSNDELLEILAQTRDPTAVQPHLRKCFDNLYHLTFDMNGVDIIAMTSGEGEKISLSMPGKPALKARGPVESWLGGVEKTMREALHREMKQCVEDYTSQDHDHWVKTHPAQLILAVEQVYWCRQITAALQSPQPAAGLAAYKKKWAEHLGGLVEMVRSQLTKLERAALTALITIDVHSRDTLDELVNDGTSAVTDFDWAKRLRYYWEPAVDDCVIRQISAEFRYSYEYLGCTPRLVITPLTDRCYITLTSALQLRLGGAPAGPAGTGKTETTKDLAKAMAMQCVVFNCSDGLDYKMMGRFFKGLAQCGAWCCFDEFNRIDIEVLSVIASQILSIKNAMMEDRDRFIFEGSEIKLDQKCGFFITMNPGYAGRTELPDNLKALFRGVTMMVPDYALIAEIMLFAEGFLTAKTLSRKMTQLYKLSSEQLSQQDHYDFGMRAVKSVLVMAGGLKRGNPSLGEDIVLIRAMRDSNVPKFLAEDVPLFMGIVQDLFPGVKIPSTNYGTLQDAIEAKLLEQKLQVTSKIVNKVLQLYETMNVRHNPKSITMSELYGSFDEISHEWKDGLVASMAREIMRDTTTDDKWIVFDGPVDALWIENMNTVLDDNKMLCLANSERIKLNDTVHMVFEVQDLAVASPATVSRCGMVYVDPSDLGWHPYVKSYVEHHAPECFTLEDRNHLMELFDTTVPEALKWCDKHKAIVPAINTTLVTSMCHLITALFEAKTTGGLLTHDETPKSEGPDQLKEPLLNFKELEGKARGAWLTMFFEFAYIWGIGGAFVATAQEEFDHHAREALSHLTPSIPPMGSVFDYVISNTHNNFVPWTVSEFKYDPAVPYFQMLVPTVDSVRFGYITEIMSRIKQHVLHTGSSGTGKSSIVNSILSQLNEVGQVVMIPVGFSARTDAARTQQMIEARLEKRRKKILGPPAGKRGLVFVDDLNMPALEEYGAQPPVEILRQFLCYNGWYDRDQLFFKELADVSLVAACAPPGGGRNNITPRMVRHFLMTSIPEQSEDGLKRIFSSILGGFLGQFGPDRAAHTDSAIKASIAVYRSCLETLRPTPSKVHYTFNLRDLSKIIQGMTSVRKGVIPDKESIARLWVHESMRVFHDRLINEDDRHWLTTELNSIVGKCFDFSWDHEEVFVEHPIMFGSFMKMGAPAEERFYEQITDMNRCGKVLTDYLDELNMSGKNEMRLVFFKDAMEHVARISRIIRQPRGNALLVGVGGSGKQSLTRLAAFMAEYECFQIELSRHYGNNEFREDLKKCYNIAGVDGKPMVFLLSDTQIIDESFLEDVNNILNSGEVPNLFENDEMDQIINTLRPVAKKAGLLESRESVKSFFIQRVRDNFHIVLAMSPVGSDFRTRMRMFPSLINVCTIDWFTRWPEQALLSVAEFFFAEEDMDDDVKKAISELCVQLHLTVEAEAEEFYRTDQRRYYTTPTSYLELIALYRTMLHKKTDEQQSNLNKLVVGLQKLQETDEQVALLKEELVALEPQLKVSAEETDKLLVTLSAETKAAEDLRKVAMAEEKVVQKQAAECKGIADSAKKDLDEAIPALKAAVKSLNALNKNDISEIKSFKTPPELVKVVMEAICVLLKKKPDWQNSKELLSDSSFLNKLYEYDKDNIPESILKKLAKYIDNPNFVPEKVEKVSVAAKSLCMWAHAMHKYAIIFREVEPKRKALEAAQAELDTAQAQLDEKQAKLREVEAKLADLQANFDQKQQQKQELEQKIALTAARFERATQLTAALGSEKERWSVTAAKIRENIKNIAGDILIASGAVAYLGAFTAPYRQKLMTRWMELCNAKGVPTSEDVSLVNTLSSAVEVRGWAMHQLPADALSIENAIMCTRGQRWPLMIDPQGQAVRWIRAMEKSAGLKIVRPTDPNMLRTMEHAIRLGSPVLLENVEEELDPALNPILQRQVFKKQGQLMIRLGETDVDYDPNFKLYITSKLPNPNLSPETQVMVTLINFTVTQSGLEDQLLGHVVRHERPDLEQQRDSIIVSVAQDKKQVAELEDKILELLSKSEGNILDDEVLINTLNESKTTSAAIQIRLEEAEKTEAEVNEAREGYRSIALRGSQLYFTLASMANVDRMYQFSLAYFLQLFGIVLQQTPPSDSISVRLNALIENATSSVYNNVCRGLFERHKLVFSFLMSTRILLGSGDITEDEWTQFIRGPMAVPQDALDKLVADVQRPEQLSELTWTRLAAMQIGLADSGFGDVLANVKTNLGAWLEWSADANLHIKPLPTAFDNPDDAGTEEAPRTPVTTFQRLLLLRAFREEKLVFGISHHVERHLGRRFIESPPMSLPEIFKDSACNVPLVFVLSTGADPMASLQTFAADCGMADKLSMVSLGQGQGPIAEKEITRARKDGSWVFLANCHLAASWMIDLERIVESFNDVETRPVDGFRLWLSSMPTDKFPVVVLQNAIKMTNEPPKGLRANVLRNYQNMRPQYITGLASHTNDHAWRKLLFGLGFFHALVQERRKFGAVGWNIQYEFSNSDYEVSCKMLNMLLSEQDHISWDAIRYLIAEINYGGRVTDDWDRRMMAATLNSLFKPDILDEKFALADGGVYYVPDDGNLSDYIAYIENLPLSEPPAVFGMHDNADIAFQQRETNLALDSVVSAIGRGGGSSGSATSADETTMELIKSIIETLPDLLNPDDAGPTTFVPGPGDGSLMHSLSTVLSQEIIRFNKVLTVVRATSEELVKAIQGLIVMSEDLDAMSQAVFANQVPKLWSAVAYPSLKPLSSWVQDLKDRIAFMHDWLVSGRPRSYWLPGFFFPQGFLTGVLQTFSRDHQVAIDSVVFRFTVFNSVDPAEIDSARVDPDGYMIHGLYMDSAAWDFGKGIMATPPFRQLYCPLPVIQLLPTTDEVAANTSDVPGTNLYAAPLYKTADRYGVLSTTGRSTNFILPIMLPCAEDPDYWVLQGTALLCALSN
ncbi:Dynein heavy chain and region D6 of dynein motor [Carpediemonas membranifera]|uniref:Dynein heavy chain and region D6 of dynein motor n=1 Tax=Carpediemonas membranifera TaxID=201153 RepID=A0A8J6B9T9_9EUKA|nr:Dynein heavy chain and region D6 of dynein motor [Carpediemonas membranifera]|eukprot:KAG9395747.1 Dynein heavy chain and region D6 of dynein motor [Carpediemonas membranifera]